jgi:hypothetical protein
MLCEHSKENRIRTEDERKEIAQRKSQPETKSDQQTGAWSKQKYFG